MSEPIKPETLVELCRLLFRRSEDTLVSLDAFQELLVAKGIISPDEFSAIYERMKSEHFARMQQLVLRAAEQHQSAQLLELLRSFEGKPQ